MRMFHLFQNETISRFVFESCLIMRMLLYTVFRFSFRVYNFTNTYFHYNLYLYVDLYWHIVPTCQLHVAYVIAIVHCQSVVHLIVYRIADVLWTISNHIIKGYRLKGNGGGSSTEMAVYFMIVGPVQSSYLVRV